MKKSYLLLATLALMNISFAQKKSSGVVSLRTGSTIISIQIDLNQTTSLATFTVVGPSTRWFSIGFNATTMASNTDCITSSGTAVLDQVLPGGHQEANTDATNNLTVVSNVVNGTSRTIIATRPFNTGDSEDYTFNFANNTLNLIWANGPSGVIDPGVEHSSFGTKSASFATLGTENFASLDKISIYPNPSNGIFTISKNSIIQITKIKIFDTNAKLLKEIKSDANNQENAIDLSSFTKGIYFMEISNKEDKIIKKIILQ
ncbi:T9SS type A sorting domain-containing protein [Flavobacterium luteum]|uniref:T9SS type A sorting domain-containing protein n=1 Tax=Flavobacterium luteum TaxID=2026654 RepID=A0A7J5AC28_9FLAO|nr:T9SS type A sorting domain-containing protein [Flavobacterium luteum]KAB1155085.1 T9SS type A sorting domain-containing protein [Flavobacterium luteum]